MMQKYQRTLFFSGRYTGFFVGTRCIGRTIYTSLSLTALPTASAMPLTCSFS